MAFIAILSGVVCYHRKDVSVLLLLAVMSLGLFVLPVMIYRQNPKLMQTGRGKVMLVSLHLMSMASPIIGMEGSFLLTTQILVIEPSGRWHQEECIFKSSYNDTLEISWGGRYIYNQIDKPLRLYQVKYGEADGEQMRVLKIIAPHTISSVPVFPEIPYGFSTPPEYIKVKRKIGDTSPITPVWETFLEVKQ